METTPKIAVVGLGYWGPKLLRNLVSMLGPSNVVAVDPAIDRLGMVTADFPGVTALNDLDAALADPELTAAVLATPVPTHAPLATKVLEADKHVLVEKPLAASTAEALDLCELAEARQRTLMVGHTFLFSPRVGVVAQMIDQGVLGRIDYATSSRLSLGLYQQANVIWDLAPHDFSILFRLLGEFPVEVQTTARCSRRPLLPDIAFINLTFPSGAVAQVTVSWLAPRKVRNTVLVGEKSMIVYDDTQPDEPVKLVDRGAAIEEGADFGANQLTYRYGDTLSPHVPADEPLGLELRHFVDCVSNGATCESDGRFGLEIVRALEAADRSWKEGGRVVELEGTRPLVLAH